MKHATATRLTAIGALLRNLRAVPGLVERKPANFCVKGQAYLDLHEDPVGLFADVKLDGTNFERYAVNTQTEQAALLDRVRDQRGA